jgi:hypothetical protein
MLHSAMTQAIATDRQAALRSAAVRERLAKDAPVARTAPTAPPRRSLRRLVRRLLPA